MKVSSSSVLSLFRFLANVFPIYHIIYPIICCIFLPIMLKTPHIELYSPLLEAKNSSGWVKHALYLWREWSYLCKWFHLICQHLLTFYEGKCYKWSTCPYRLRFVVFSMMRYTFTQEVKNMERFVVLKILKHISFICFYC